MRLLHLLSDAFIFQRHPALSLAYLSLKRRLSEGLSMAASLALEVVITG
jgi:hypothetical protein